MQGIGFCVLELMFFGNEKGRIYMYHISLFLSVNAQLPTPSFLYVWHPMLPILLTKTNQKSYPPLFSHIPACIVTRTC